MKVILLENVRKVGSIGEIIDVKRGFARNFLISKKKALFASKENIKEVEKIKQDLSKKDEDRRKEAKLINEKIKLELSKKDQERKKEAKEIHEKIQNKEYEIKKLSTENKELYGSVKPTEISKILEIAHQFKINPSLIQPSKEIKSLGNFDVLINLHPEVQTQIVIKTIAQEEEN